MRVAFDETGTEAHRRHQLAHARIAFGTRADELKRLQRLADDLPDRHARIQRGIRVLKDHLQMTPRAAQLALRQMRQIASTKDHLPARRLSQTQERTPQS